MPTLHLLSICRRIVPGSLALAALLALTPVASEALTFTLSATDSGWHSDDGNHTASNQNYTAGWSNDEFRNFFVFDLSSLPIGETVLSVTLRAYNPADGEPDASFEGGYDSPDATEGYTLREVLATSAIVTAPTIANTAVYNDLGDGTVFGTQTVSAADNGSFIQVVLNGSGIAAVQTRVGLTDIVLGGHLTTLTSAFGVEEFVWGHTDPAGLGPYTRELVVVMTPEPGTALLLALGVVTLAARRRGARA